MRDKTMRGIARARWRAGLLAAVLMPGAGALLAGVLVDLTAEPPAVVEEWPAVADCRRDAAGISFALTNTAFDLDFRFLGLPAGAPIAYALTALGLPLATGSGASLPLSDWPLADRVDFFSPDPSVAWAPPAPAPTLAGPETVAAAPARAPFASAPSVVLAASDAPAPADDPPAPAAVPDALFPADFTPVGAVMTAPGFGLSAVVPASLAASEPGTHLIARVDRVAGDEHPRFTTNYVASVRPLADGTAAFTLAADDDADLTLGDETLSVRWHPDRGAPASRDFAFRAGETVALSLRHYNDGGAYFLDCTAACPSAPALAVEPRVRTFFPAPGVDLRALAPAVRVTGTLDPLCDYTIRAEYEAGLVAAPSGSLVPAGASPSADLPVWPDSADSAWSIRDAPRATVAYILFENGVPRATNTCTFVCLAPKLDDPCGCCGEGFQAAAGCVEAVQRFGRSPQFPQLPVGRAVVRADRPNGELWTPAALRYDHPMMRRIHFLDGRDAVVFDGLGRPTEYCDGRPGGASLGDTGRFLREADGTPVEELADGLRVRYGADGTAVSLQGPYGDPIPVAALGIRVARAADGSVAAVESDADGRLAAAVTGPDAWRLTWTSPFGATVKTFDFGGDGAGVFTLLETRDANFAFRYRWTYESAQDDWTFERLASDGSAVRRETKSLAYNPLTRTWKESRVSLDADGAPLAATEIVLSRDGHALRELSRADGVSGRVLSAATLDSCGRVAAETGELGCTRTFAYDGLGRIVRETVAAEGVPVRVTETRYDDDGPYALRPRTRRTLADDCTLLEELWAYGPQAVAHARTAHGVTRTSLLAYDAAGRETLAAGEDGRATRTGRTEPGTDGSWTETAEEGVWTEDGGFAPVDGRSTRLVMAVDAQGNAVRRDREALVGDVWRTLSWETNRYDAAHRAVFTAHADGTTEAAEWICTGPVWRRTRDGIVTTNAYGSAKELIATTRRGPFGEVATALVYDAAGRVVREETAAAGCETATVTRAYDPRGRVIAAMDAAGATTLTAYSPDGRETAVTYPDGGTRVTRLHADGSLASVTGTAVTPEYRTCGVTDDGLEWTLVRYGHADSSRYEKTYRNGFGELVRTERPGFGGATLVTENAYDARGRLVTTTETGRPTVTYAYDAWGDLVETTQTAGGVSRTVGESQGYALFGGEVWHGGTRTVATSDPAIAPLATESWSRVSGLTLSCNAESFTVDVRGNTNRTWSVLDPATATRTTRTQQAGVANVAEEETVDGVTVRDVSFSAVTNTATCDPLRRVTARTDGRGNMTTTTYDAAGRLAAVTDPAGAVTRYGYDAMGRVVAVTNALGAVTTYAYDLRGNKTYEGGATYPVRYDYDIYGDRVAMTTWRDEAAGAGDTTSWERDEATGLVTRKTYADGQGPSYRYDADGRLAKRTWARGIETTYSYDAWGRLVRTDYSDNTPTVSLTYDAMGRQTRAVDAAGVTTFAYDSFGSLTNETVVGVAGTNTIERYYDSFGRSLGYALNGVRQSALAYDPATGRLAMMQIPSGQSNNPNNQTIQQFTWNYLAGSDLKSSLAYPNGLAASWQYDANGQLLQVKNAFPTNTISQYDYAYDAGGRRVQITRSGSAMSETRTDVYGYNIRSELVSATKCNVDSTQPGTVEYAYQYDDIGNRITSVEPDRAYTYIANNLNQYVALEPGRRDVPVASTEEGCASIDDAAGRRVSQLQYDLDGNQTLIQIETGIWSVSYNGENRPVNWSCGTTNLVMKYDFMGRRVEYIETVVNADDPTQVTTNKHQRFVYDNYLCIQRLNGTDNAVTDVFEWDLTEPIATRPLFWQRREQGEPSRNFFYTHDGNKNVSEVISYSAANGVVVHYEYTPFGQSAAFVQDNLAETMDCGSLNPWLTSSEYQDSLIRMTYFNYRHLDLICGRWTARDPLSELAGSHLYSYMGNRTSCTDLLGLWKDEGVSGNRRVYVREIGDTFYDLSQIVHLDYGEVKQWARSEDSVGCKYSVPNVWIDADLLQGPAELYDHIVNIGGTVGSFVSTDLFVWKKTIIKVDSVDALLNALRGNKGDIWGLQVYAHGDPSGEIVGMPSTPEMRADMASFQDRRWTTQDKLIEAIKQGKYKVSRAYMMQCNSAAGEYDDKWRSVAVDFYGYKGMNVFGLDMASTYWPWNWSWTWSW